MVSLTCHVKSAESVSCPNKPFSSTWSATQRTSSDAKSVASASCTRHLSRHTALPTEGGPIMFAQRAIKSLPVDKACSHIMRRIRPNTHRHCTLLVFMLSQITPINIFGLFDTCLANSSFDFFRKTGHFLTFLSKVHIISFRKNIKGNFVTWLP